MRATAILLVGALALVGGCDAPLGRATPRAGEIAQAAAADNSPKVPEGAQMRFPFPFRKVTYDVAVAEIAGANGGLISMGVRNGTLPDEPTTRVAAQNACAVIGRIPDPAVVGTPAEARWIFAGGCK